MPEDAIPVAQRWRVMPRHFLGFDSPLDAAVLSIRDWPDVIAPVGVHPLHPNGLVIVAEPTWSLVLAMLPPALVVVLMQKWFVKGLVDTEK